ncbi:hypothetical protein SCORR_v1c02740 [Spiroplasma corruscae]|uniref:Uncharacterized protein n=1 Tax=Spiroplasma corruscae TaxID=216934 RepID=A0A222ENH7_9MOLU|nr:hypothetical protein [Spiroplasma corruscae]ASP28048.1 hypothetical protein SCORR_v1c02740 [Spiroplasma corruscae]
MLYMNNNFWIKTGIDHTKNLLKFIGNDFDDTKFLNETFTNLFTKNLKDLNIEDGKLKSYVLSWFELKNIIVNWKEKSSKDNSFRIEMKHFESLYMIIDKNGTYWQFFQEVSDEKEEFEIEINKVFQKVLKTKYLKPTLEKLLIFCHKIYLDGLFGRYTSLFVWLLLQLFLIFKNFAPIITLVDKNTQILWLFPLINMLYNELSCLPMAKWKRSPYFKKVFNYCYANSYSYKIKIKNIL